MAKTKRTSTSKGSATALTVLGFAGISLAAMTGGSEALMLNAAPLQVTPIGEEEISDVTLATFHLYDKDSVGTKRSMLQLTKCGGCHGCGGRGCRCGGRGCRCGGRCGGCGGGCGWGGCCLSWGGCRPWC